MAKFNWEDQESAMPHFTGVSKAPMSEQLQAAPMVQGSGDLYKQAIDQVRPVRTPYAQNYRLEQGPGGAEEAISPIDFAGEIGSLAARGVGVLGREALEAAPRLIGNEIGAINIGKGDSIKKLIDAKSKAKNALPLDYESRMARAKKMGFTTDAFHGTKADIKSFDPNALGASTNAGSARQGFFFAQDPSTASDYATLAKSRGQLEGASQEKIDGEYLTNISNKLRKKYGEDFYTPERYAKRLADIEEQKAQFIEMGEPLTPEELKTLEIHPSKIVPENEPLLKKYNEANDKYGQSFDKKINDSPEIEEKISQLVKQQKDNATEMYKHFDLNKSWDQQTGKYRDLQIKNSELLENISSLEKSKETNGANVLPVKLKMDNPYIHDFKGSGYRDETYASIMDKAKKKGHDSVIFKNTYDAADSNNKVLQDIYAVFEPHQIRSVNATFDPKKIKSKDILAGLGAVATGTAASNKFNWDEQDEAQ